MTEVFFILSVKLLLTTLVVNSYLIDSRITIRFVKEIILLFAVIGFVVMITTSFLLIFQQ